jgi:hypothetical protein
VKTQQAGKDLMGAAVICELWRLAVALSLFAFPSCMYKSSINLLTNPDTSMVTPTRDSRDLAKFLPQRRVLFQQVVCFPILSTHIVIFMYEVSWKVSGLGQKRNAGLTYSILAAIFFKIVSLGT